MSKFIKNIHKFRPIFLVHSTPLGSIVDFIINRTCNRPKPKSFQIKSLPTFCSHLVLFIIFCKNKKKNYCFVVFEKYKEEKILIIFLIFLSYIYFPSSSNDIVRNLILILTTMTTNKCV